ncbi:MAG: hypothetical protein ACFFD4_16595 [Candidatus Odinarchaeota archaeon]
MLATRLVKNAKGLYMVFPETGRFPPSKQENGAGKMLIANYLLAREHRYHATFLHPANGQKNQGKLPEQGILRNFRFTDDSSFKHFNRTAKHPGLSMFYRFPWLN